MAYPLRPFEEAQFFTDHHGANTQMEFCWKLCEIRPSVRLHIVFEHLRCGIGVVVNITMHRVH
jgi:hypothetical protein